MFNKVILVGRLCTDPKLKYTPSGVAVTNFRIAVDRPFANVSGERETDFIDIVVWRQSAEFVNTYVTKGRLVLIGGMGVQKMMFFQTHWVHKWTQNRQLHLILLKNQTFRLLHHYRL